MLYVLSALMLTTLTTIVTQHRIPAAAAALLAAAAVVLHLGKSGGGRPAAHQADGEAPVQQEQAHQTGSEATSPDEAAINDASGLQPGPDAGREDGPARQLIDEFRILAPNLESLAAYVMKESEEAATQSTKSAFAIADDARSASTRVTSLLTKFSRDDDSLDTRISRLSSVLGQFGVLVSELREVEERYRRDMTRMDDLAQSVIKQTTMIQDIAERTSLLSINASIEAARAGENGKGFTVIAQEVRKLSESTSDITDQINSVIRDFGETVKDSSSLGNSRLSNVLNSIDQTRESLNSIVTMLSPQVEHISMSVSEAESLTASVSEKLENVTIWFQTQDTLRQVIDHISGAINEIRHRCEKEITAEVGDDIQADVLRKLTSRFTVETEWKALGLEPPAGDVGVTLF